VSTCTHTQLETLILDECMTLWGEPEQLHMNNVEQLHVHDWPQNDKEGTHMHIICTTQVKVLLATCTYRN